MIEYTADEYNSEMPNFTEMLKFYLDLNGRENEINNIKIKTVKTLSKKFDQIEYCINDKSYYLIINRIFLRIKNYLFYQPVVEDSYCFNILNSTPGDIKNIKPKLNDTDMTSDSLNKYLTSIDFDKKESNLLSLNEQRDIANFIKQSNFTSNATESSELKSKKFRELPLAPVVEDNVISTNSNDNEEDGYYGA